MAILEQAQRVRDTVSTIKPLTNDIVNVENSQGQGQGPGQGQGQGQGQGPDQGQGQGPSKGQEPKKNPNRCFHGDCKKKLLLSDQPCTCNERYCSSHRMPEDHNCTFDFKAAGKRLLEKQNPKVDGVKLARV